MHPYMTEQLAVLRQRQLLEEAEVNRLVRRRSSWLRGSLGAVRRAFSREPKPRTAAVTPRTPQRVEDVVVAR
jgi:hypothetical protein